MLALLLRLETWVSHPRRERLAVGLLLLLAFAARMAWLLSDPESRLGRHKSEAWNAAAHWAATGVVGDVYAQGTGISSHVGPFNTVLAGSIYRLFGTATPTSELILSVIAASVVTLLFWVLYQVARELGVAVLPRLAALFVLAAGTLYYYAEMTDFRVREAGWNALLMATMLWRLLVLDRQGGLHPLQIAGFALLAGFAFLVNSGIALGGYLGLGFVILRHVKPLDWPATALVLLAAFLVMNGAWMVRNYQVYDRFMPSRGNFWLEVSIANHPGALTLPPERAFQQQMFTIHPTFSEAARNKIKELGSDAAYFDLLGVETKAWIGANPEAFLALSARHIGEYFLPPRYMWDIYGMGAPGGVRLKQAWIWGFTILGLMGLALGLAEASRRYLFVVAALLPPVLLYALVQPTLRYRYLLAGLLTYLAMHACWRLATAILGLFSGPRSSTAAPEARF
jgi:hypothetical protein